jgi:hypothetical protein
MTAEGGMRWFRLYSEIKDDPKVLCLTDTQFRLWIGLLCMASESTERGTIPSCPLMGLAAALRTTKESLTEALDLFGELGMVERDDDGAILVTHFLERQYDNPSDQPEQTRERKRRQRARDSESSHADVTSESRDGHDTEKRREEERRVEKTKDPSGAAAPAPAKATAKPTNPDSGLREDQVMWNVLLGVFGVPDGTRPSDAARAKWNDAIKQFRGAGVKAADLPNLADRYEQLFGKRPPTPHSMVAHLLELRSNAPPPPVPRSSTYQRPVMTKQEAEDDEWDRQLAAKIERDKAAALSRVNGSAGRRDVPALP